jgi:nucleoside phosphorylase
MNRSFRALRLYFVVRIGGGVPSRAHDIRLGDVIVGTRVIQHDFGKAMQNATMIKATADIQVPDTFLRSIISGIKDDPFLPVDLLDDYIAEVVKLRPEHKHPGEKNDKLFVAEYPYEGSVHGTFGGFNAPKITRSIRPQGVKAHYGLIAPGN